MMYHYITLSDGTEITHSHLIEDDNVEKLEVHFERPTENGFDSARCVLPTYEWKFIEGYNKDEIDFFIKFIENNAHLLYKYAAHGGIQIA